MDLPRGPIQHPLVHLLRIAIDPYPFSELFCMAVTGVVPITQWMFCHKNVRLLFEGSLARALSWLT